MQRLSTPREMQLEGESSSGSWRSSSGSFESGDRSVPHSLGSGARWNWSVREGIREPAPAEYGVSVVELAKLVTLFRGCMPAELRREGVVFKGKGAWLSGSGGGNMQDKRGEGESGVVSS